MSKRKRAVEYWSVALGQDEDFWRSVCSSHRTQRAAVKEALRCERTSCYHGEHMIVQVAAIGTGQQLKRSGRP